MIEKALYGDRRYWIWLALLAVIVATGTGFYLRQFFEGLAITGLSRDVSWGFYISQFTFLVGVAASAVMLVLPYYLHNYKAFGKITILGEFVAIAAVVMCMTFIFVDMGQPFRILNVFLYPSPNSLMFWDTVSLFGYMVLNVIITYVTLKAESKSIAPPKWIKPVIIISIPWAISIHTVTAFLYSGLAARPFWMTAVLAPRFLASAFASGPSLLILLCFILRKVANYDAGKEAIQKLAEIVTYAMIVNVFFILMEIFTAFYSGIPEHAEHFEYLMFGLEGKTALMPWMWASWIMAAVTLVMLINPATRRNERTLKIAVILVVLSIWIDKGLGMVVTGFIPNPFGHVTEYTPTFPEMMISLAIYGMGMFIITIFYKVALSLRDSLAK